jgi:hypothetical protein
MEMEMSDDDRPSQVFLQRMRRLIRACQKLAEEGDSGSSWLSVVRDWTGFR